MCIFCFWGASDEECINLLGAGPSVTDGRLG